MPLTIVGGEQSSSALAIPAPRPTSPPDTNKAVASPTVSRFIVLPFTMPTVAGHAEPATDALENSWCAVQPLSGSARCANNHVHTGEIARHLRPRLAQRRSTVTVLSVLRMNPHPNVHLAVDQLAEHHSDCLRSVFGDQPHRVLSVDPPQRRADLVIETSGRAAGAVARGIDIGRPRPEKVPVRLAGERP